MVARVEKNTAWYTARMTPHTIKDLVGAYRGPIRIVMADGREFVVRSGEDLFITTTHLHGGLDPDENGLPSRSRYLDARSVTQVEPLPPEPASDGNGADR